MLNCVTMLFNYIWKCLIKYGTEKQIGVACVNWCPRHWLHLVIVITRIWGSNGKLPKWSLQAQLRYLYHLHMPTVSRTWAGFRTAHTQSTVRKRWEERQLGLASHCAASRLLGRASPWPRAAHPVLRAWGSGGWPWWPALPPRRGDWALWGQPGPRRGPAEGSEQAWGFRQQPSSWALLEASGKSKIVSPKKGEDIPATDLLPLVGFLSLLAGREVALPLPEARGSSLLTRLPALTRPWTPPARLASSARPPAPFSRARTGTSAPWVNGSRSCRRPSPFGSPAPRPTRLGSRRACAGLGGSAWPLPRPRLARGSAPPSGLCRVQPAHRCTWSGTYSYFLSGDIFHINVLLFTPFHWNILWKYFFWNKHFSTSSLFRKGWLSNYSLPFCEHCAFVWDQIALVIFSSSINTE